MMEDKETTRHDPGDRQAKDAEPKAPPVTERVVLSIEAADAMYDQGYIAALKFVMVLFCVTLICMRVWGPGGE
jgi:hypothetical protein